jgi:CRP-like cAMP-binding protein
VSNGLRPANRHRHGDESDDAETGVLLPIPGVGKKDVNSIRIELRISQAELSQMVGTTRPRISLFMQRFQNLGLIETNKDHFFIIKEKKLTDYVGHIA